MNNQMNANHSHLIPSEGMADAEPKRENRRME